MILDTLHNADKYTDIHPAFKKAFEFLWQPDLAELKPGKYDIEEGLYVIILKEQGRKKADADIEIHRDWIDIQYVISGLDNMGWKAASELADQVSDYDADKDLHFFNDEPSSWMAVGPGEFAVFFPEDAHLPMISDGMLHKAVVKIAVS